MEDLNGYMLLLREIETIKCSFDIETDVVFILPDTLTAHDYGESSAEEAIEVYKRAHHNVDLYYRKPNFSIPASFFAEALMEPTIKSTFKHVSGILAKNRSVSRIILAGNFANSRLLQKEFKALESEIVRVLVPNTPGEAVMKGAVLFGANPALVPERVSRYTYGVGISKEFIQGVHPEEKRYVNKEGFNYCTSIFDTFVMEGQDIALGETVERTYTPVEPDQTSITFSIYKSPRKKVEFVDDFRVQNMGTITINISEKNENVKFLMMFSTEIVAKAVNKAGEVQDVRRNFNE